MKKTITTIILSTAFTVSAFAADYLEVTNLEQVNNTTVASYKRYSTERDFFTSIKVFQGNLSMQEAVTKLSYFADDYITVTGKNASSTKGQVNELANLRSNAWYAKGLAGYFAEVARQMDLTN